MNAPSRNSVWKPTGFARWHRHDVPTSLEDGNVVRAAVLKGPRVLQQEWTDGTRFEWRDVPEE